ncbi:14365_t:CDS:2 [Cetraspora pellucida]|uniref:14365_t:CDS:1 n=1 Tax=Cetraspora pellucida TaxID=1433469 RepID=A0A9N9A4W6_9GLOM|nr:14365_t:CDS:2 [Cetraspora pellucida]
MFNTDEIYPGRTGKHETDPSLWSYVDFLEVNHTLIINSPPFKDQWNTLDGKELLDVTLREAFERKVNLERAKSNLYSFWQKVITERLRNQVQITYEKETLLTFDESGKFFGKKLRLPYHKEATSSDCKRFHSTLDSDSTSPVETKKIRPGEDVNVEEANNDDAVKMTSIAYQQFTNKYRKIKEEDKWTLSTEKTFLLFSLAVYASTYQNLAILDRAFHAIKSPSWATSQLITNAMLGLQVIYILSGTGSFDDII